MQTGILSVLSGLQIVAVIFWLLDHSPSFLDWLVILTVLVIQQVKWAFSS
jgi:hypothetical protein